MALVTFGQTIRGGTTTTPTTATYAAIGIKNTTTTNLVINLLHGVTLAPGAIRFFSFNDLDDRFRFNPRAHNVDVVSTDGKKPYLDDVNEFAKLVTNGTLVVFTATQVVSATTYTLGTSAVPTFTNDGSVYFA